ncbi:MAG: type II toxin-antitoxin system VapC family toxin [Actinomycetota bacterium]|nr:type II toxin-antitoxin system VapC family toxin [Actinomycetota bacterium]PLS74985.1 MAG: PIN domain nuclease [Actinomycetota bacterium]
MNLLLDTHALLWWLAGAPMDADARARISDPTALVVVSAASVWEVAVKQALGRLSFEGSMVDHVEHGDFEPLPISLRHAERAGRLPPHHRDPFDRMLVAQAQAEALTLVTRDPAFDAYEVEVLRC